MMAKPSDAPGFKALLEEWNQKLEESGFIDIEREFKGKRQLKMKTGTEIRFQQMDPKDRAVKARYFEIIGQKIIETRFESDEEQQILTLYFEGKSQEQIRKEMGCHRYTVYRKLTKWLKLWGLK